jgi:hypothetical protein
MNKPLYYVQAYRLGKMNDHSYVVGIWEDSNEAQLAAEKEEQLRGGKYECVVYLAYLNEPLEPWEEDEQEE